MTTMSPVSSIWAVAWAKRDSSRSSGGMANRPGRPATSATSAANSRPAPAAAPIIQARSQASWRWNSTILLSGYLLRYERPMNASASAAPDYSVVVPVFDEGGAAPALAREIAAAFAGENHEIIFIDDASRDDTAALLAALKAEIPQLRVLSHRKNSGQSRAVRSGVLAARAPIDRHPGRRRPERPGRRAAPGQGPEGRPARAGPGGRRAGQAPGQPGQALRLQVRQRRAQAHAEGHGQRHRLRARRPSAARPSCGCPTSITSTATCRP